MIKEPREKAIEILGVGVDRMGMEEVMEKLEEVIEGRKKALAVTPNPEIILAAQGDGELKEILNKADLAIPDGVGLLAAGKFLQQCQISNVKCQMFKFWSGFRVGWAVLFDRKYLGVIPEQVSGDILFAKLIEWASEMGWRVFLLGGRPGVAKEAERRLKEKYPKLKIESSRGAEEIREESKEQKEKIINQINIYRPQLLFVAYGAPWQEKWLARNWQDLKVNVALGIGGTLDEIAGVVSPTPRWMRRAGLRWLWRLATQPKRWKRIWRATVVFGWRVFKRGSGER